MKIETTTGRYALNIEGEVKPEKVAAAVQLGIAQGVLYRGVFAEAREVTGAKRKMEDSAAFDEAKAAKLVEMVEKALAEWGEFVAEASRYDGAEAKQPLFKREKEIVSGKGGDEDRLVALADAVGYTVGLDPLTVENAAFLRAIKDHLDAKAREAMAGI